MINTLSFVLGLMNLEENLTQSDKQDIVDNLNKKSEELLTSIDTHLKKQDEKLNYIIALLTN